ncbi:hypothetical protein PRZ48_004449 [Zasmidium cellare]|uniref:mitogen-activated protein kinase kinase n=1 Tax=Zasmidium cellare TaxID=395010 RepID=A0ABR0EQ87_ZASCE|nr:hypothetical protein PRZ48_004449 [Zasmidium cellare]
MAAHIAWLPRTFGTKESPPHKSRSRPLPLRIRTYSEAGSQSPGFDESHEGRHLRNKSLSVATQVAEFSPTTLQKMEDEEEEEADEVETIANESPRSSLDGSVAGFSDNSSLAGSPLTPLTGLSSGRSSLDSDGPEILSYDFSKIDYELERAKVLGTGLWSTVYMAEQKPVQPSRTGLSLLSPPRSPRLTRRKPRTASIPSLFAIKTIIRQDAKPIFHQEARVLTHLQRHPTSALHIIPFYGLDPRNNSLIFEAVIGGSLEDLTSRMKQMTEVARHLELITLFPGLAFDLINGLDFLHAHGVIHADIKPANILLDISHHLTDNKPIVRARYIDFSAAFIPSKGDSASDAGGTWDFMAPEQMRIQPEFNTPTFASDVWSLGITLLYVMVGESPYSEACGGNVFMLREAIKTGDPLQFARMDSRVRKRLAACQDFVDCVRLAVKKERDIRITAAGWAGWLVEWEREG